MRKNLKQTKLTLFKTGDRNHEIRLQIVVLFMARR